MKNYNYVTGQLFWYRPIVLGRRICHKMLCERGDFARTSELHAVPIWDIVHWKNSARILPLHPICAFARFPLYQLSKVLGWV
jgi:hypothetical protein